MAYNAKCERAFALLSDSSVPGRIRACKRASEYGFALLLSFAQIEASLKILRYWQRTKDGWPDRLDFLHASWAPLRDLKALDRIKYDSLIGVSGRSLRETRNRIAHEGHSIDHGEYLRLYSVAGWAMTAISVRLPERADVRKRVDRLRSRRVTR